MPVVFHVLLVLLISACALEPLPADNASAGKLSLTQPVMGALLKDETLTIEDRRNCRTVDWPSRRR